MKKEDFGKKSLALHKKLKGKIRTGLPIKIKNRRDLSLLYTPGVGAVSSYVAKNKDAAKEYTIKGRMVAVISDGSAVLGLGNIGPLGALPVMEGKAALFKALADVDAFPIVLSTQNLDEIIETIVRIAPAFAGINLEDIAAPGCFYVEEELKKRLDIPVMHDDQHGTAIVVLAALMNAMKVVKKNLNSPNTRIIISGVGAAGVAIMKLIKLYAPKVNIVALDSAGVVWKGRTDLNPIKQKLIKEKIIFAEGGGDLSEALTDADVFIGVSKPSVLTKEMIKTMARDPIVFAMANPTPEIMPEEAKKGGAAIIATGRSDYPNQINNVLVFPGVFRGAIDNNVKKVTDKMKLQAAKNLAQLIRKPSKNTILPTAFDTRVVGAIARAIR